jgi:hypothetical protein
MVNALNDYDLVWALTQGTINAQLAWLFTKLTPPGQRGIEHVSFGQLFEADGKTVKDGLHVDGDLGVPSIEIGEGNDNTVFLFVPFERGTLQHLGLGGGVYTVDLRPDPEHRAATTWTLCFKVDLNIADITSSLDCSTGRPPRSMHQETYDRLCHFKSSDFTVRQIFLDVQNVDLARYRSERSTIPATVVASVTSDGTTTPSQPDPQAAVAMQRAMTLYLQDLRADGRTNPYILGYTANASFDEVSALQPTGTVYSTHAYEAGANQPAEPDLSTFEFLLVTHHKTPPLTNLGFSYNLVDRAGISGTGRVANATVVRDWLANSALPHGSLIDAISRAVGVSLKPESYDPARHQWTGSQTYIRRRYEFGVIGIEFVTADVKSIHAVTVAFSQSVTDSSGKRGPGLQISGTFAARFEFDATICDGHYTRFQPFSMSILMSPGIGANANSTVVLSRSQVSLGDPWDDSDLGEACDIPKLKDVGEDIMKLVLTKPLADLDGLEVQRFASAIDGGLKTLSSQVILPAPSIFAYKDVSFNDEFDLVTELNYITQDQ